MRAAIGKADTRRWRGYLGLTASIRRASLMGTDSRGNPNPSNRRECHKVTGGDSKASSIFINMGAGRLRTP